ncbi:MAG: DNA primase small subunit domain-containing protein [Nanoarchaeota archaeon]
MLRDITKRFYSRKDVQRVILKTAKNREVAVRYGENFGRRPDTLNYENDIFELAKRGATSFHCSEERWKDPLKLTAQMSKSELEELRTEWDLLIDIDCKYLEYSKTAASLIVEALHFHNIQNFGIKFSGGTGFHIGIPFESFPKSIDNVKIKNYFPDGARLILEYLKDMIKKELASRIMELETTREIATVTGKKEEDLMERGQFNPFKIIELDSGLISSRHLFRMPYSLNEKTSLVSVVIDEKQLEKFKPSLAKANNVDSVIDFFKDIEKEEARELFMQGFDWKKIRVRDRERFDRERGPVMIKAKVTDEDFAPCMKKALEGMKRDGRKRCLFILLNYFRSLNMPFEEIESRVREWNQKNYAPLKESYITAQLNWHKKSKPMLPPNCDHPFYKELEIYTPECEYMKNPVSYTIRKLRTSKRVVSKKVGEEKE